MANKISISNTLTQKKDPLKPLKGKKINMFVCGPTVYDYSHLGHARLALVFDSFVKYLKASGYTVFYLQNITDILPRPGKKALVQRIWLWLLKKNI